MEVVGRAGCQLGDQVEVEGAGLVRLSVDEEATAANVLADVEQPGDGISEEAGTEPSSLVVGVDAETGE